MRFGIVITATDPRLAAALAAEAEAAGWDGVFTYDSIAIGDWEGFDPWKLARELTTLDVLSGGRAVFPVGLGAIDDAGFGRVGEPVEARARAQLLDETLAIVDGLASGEPFAFEGEHYRFEPMTFRPTPVQRPRVPVWVVGAWPAERSMRRAARWDGLIVQAVEDGEPTGAPRDLVPIVDWIRRERAEAGLAGPFDIVVGGSTPADEPEVAASLVRRHEANGATWWIEQDWADTDPEALRTRIAAGPPHARAGDPPARQPPNDV